MDTTYATPYGSFEWDSDKNAINLKKHGMDFILATEAFADDDALIFRDSEHSLGEERYKLLGQIGGVVVVLVVFTERTAFRLISARKATRQEKKIYAERNR